MLFSWFIKSVPRSVRSILMLSVMIGGFALAFSALLGLFVPGSDTPSKMTVQFLTGLAILLPATIVFYYFQAMDDKQRHRNAESERRE